VTAIEQLSVEPNTRWAASVAHELRRLAIRTTRWDRVFLTAVAVEEPRSSVPAVAHTGPRVILTRVA
jgi:hypothetical protein